MKVFYSCLSKSWGGMEMFTLTAIKQLLSRDIRVELLCAKDSRIHIEARSIGIIIHPIKYSGAIHPYATIKVASIIRRGNFDIVHTQASKDLWLLVPALKLLGRKIPLLLTKQVGSYIIKKDILHKWIYRRVTYAIAISNVIKQNLIDTCPIDSKDILLLHNGIDIRKFDPSRNDLKDVRNEFQIKSNEIVIGMMARFSPGKGHEDFLEAANILSKRYSHLKFLITGEASRGEGDYAESIKKLSNGMNLKNVIFTGYRPDTPDVLNSLDIFVFPSHNEALGIALIEAMAMAKPSVCSNSDGVLDIAVEGETSLLFETKDPPDLADKIDKLINSKQLCLQLGQGARERVVNMFDLELLTNDIISIYKKSIKKE